MVAAGAAKYARPGGGCYVSPTLFIGAHHQMRIAQEEIFSPDVDASAAFYNSIGFRVTEYTNDADRQKLWAAWMHRTGGVHDMAFTNWRGPRLHHLAFWVPTPLNIIDLLDLMATTGYVPDIKCGLGRHGF